MYNDFSEEIAKDLIITAFEGGSNYWYMIESETHGDDLGTLFKEGLEISNANLGIEADEFRSGFLTKETLLKGAKIMEAKYPRHFYDAINENGDAATGDVYLQCALFGEVIYG